MGYLGTAIQRYDEQADARCHPALRLRPSERHHLTQTDLPTTSKIDSPTESWNELIAKKCRMFDSLRLGRGRFDELATDNRTRGFCPKSTASHLSVMCFLACGCRHASVRARGMSLRRRAEGFSSGADVCVPDGRGVYEGAL